MSAFGQSVGNSMAHDYEVLLHRFVRQQVQLERQWLEDRLRELKPGEIWCQHETRSHVGEYGTWTRTLTGHTLPAGKVCAMSGVRVQFGPAPEQE